jgi:hypothetical protein
MYYFIYLPNLKIATSKAQISNVNVGKADSESQTQNKHLKNKNWLHSIKVPSKMGKMVSSPGFG